MIAVRVAMKFTHEPLKRTPVALHMDADDQVVGPVLTDRSGTVHASLRPEDIVLSKEPFRSSARNVLKGAITDIVDRGTLIYVTVDVPPSFICAITRTSLEEMAVKESAEIHIAFKASAVHIF